MARQQPSAEYRGYRTAGIRLADELDPSLAPHREDLDPDLVAGMHAFDKAHVVMLAEVGLIARTSAAAILRELTRYDDAPPEVRQAAGGGLHSGEVHLVRALGEDVGGQLHLGRSSGDLGAVAQRWAWRSTLHDLACAINELRDVLLGLAEVHATAVLPGTTQAQHAQPVTLGHWCAAWEAALQRDVERIGQVSERVNRSPAGAGIMAGSSMSLDRRRTAQLLGFDEPLHNTMDAIQSHDVATEVAGLLALLATGVAQRATDLMLWFGSEHRYIDVPDRFCGTSSIMPQKKNPYLLEEIRGLAVRTTSTATAMLSLNGQGSGWATLEWGPIGNSHLDLVRQVTQRLAQLARMVEELRVNRRRMAEAAASHWANATYLATELVVAHGISWRSAHQIVGILVRRSERDGWRPDELTPDRLREASTEYFGRPLTLPATELQAAMDPMHSVEHHTVLGGPAPQSLAAELGPARDRLAADRAAVDDRRATAQRAERRLDAAVRALIG